MSITAFVGILLYAVVAAACAAAGLVARKAGARGLRPPREARGWLLASLVFAALIVLALGNVTGLLQGFLRQLLVDNEQYASRWEVQAPLSALLVLATGGCAWLGLRQWQRHRRSRAARLLALAVIAALGYLPLLLARIISFHQLDKLLYTGPLRLNWLIDGGLALTVATCALLYIRLIGQQAAPIQRR